MATGPRSELPSSEYDLSRGDARTNRSTALAGSSSFISNLGFSSHPVSQNDRLGIGRQPSFVALGSPGSPNSNMKLSLEPNDQNSSHSLDKKSDSKVQDDITLPLHIHRTPGIMMDCRPRKIEYYSPVTQMNITASRLDRQINNFIEETAAKSTARTDASQPSLNSSDRVQRNSTKSFLSERPESRDPGAHETEDEDEEEDENEFCFDAPPSSLRMAGSRPPSRAMSTRSRSRAPSTCSSFVAGEEEAQIPGYLFLHEVQPLRIKKSRVLSNHSSSHSPDGNGKSRIASRTSSHHTNAFPRRPKVFKEMQPQSQDQAKPATQAAEPNAKTCSHVLKSPQHVWYFIRRLVGLEIRWEAARAWKLTDLNLGSVVAAARHPTCEADNDESNYSWDSSSDETTTAAENLPILRYLIQNFLLTLPIIRDVTSNPPTAPQNFHINSQVPPYGTSLSVYWTAGVLPVLRKLHQSNLSAAIDLGSPGFLHTILDSHLARFLEHFIATSLRLCVQGSGVIPYFTQTADPAGSTIGDLAISNELSPSKNLVQFKPFEVPSLKERENGIYSLSEKPMIKNVEGTPEFVKFSVDRLSDQAIDRLSENDSASHRQETNAIEREQTGTYMHSFEREPQRYSGISVQPSQRASIGVITPSNSNCMPEVNVVNPSGDKDSTDMSPVIVPGVRRLSQSASVKRGTSGGHSPSDNKLDPLAIRTSEEVNSVRQTIERLKSERNNPNERDKEDIKSRSSSRLSRKFSWKRANGPKTAANTQLDDSTAHKFSTNSNTFPDFSPSSESQVRRTPILNISLHANDRKESLCESDCGRELSTMNIGANGFGKVEREMIKHTVNHRDSDLLIPNIESDENHYKRAPLLIENSGLCIADNIALTNVSLEHPGDPGTESDSEGKTPNRWGFALKSLSLPKNVDTARTRQQSQKEYKPSLGLKSVTYPRKSATSSLGPLSSKLSEIRESDSPVPGAVVPESLVKGLSSPYENIYQPQSFQLQFELLEFPKSSIPWPWGDPVPFWKGTPVHKLSWGGFEVDLVGVRSGMNRNKYIIRVRRPSRLDEYVLRKESQFKKYYARLTKDFPNAYIRRIPDPDAGQENPISSLDGLLQGDDYRLIPNAKWDDGRMEVDSRGSGESRMERIQVDFETRSYGNTHFLDPFSNKPLNHVAIPVGETPKRRTTLASILGIGNHRSKFSMDTRSDWNESFRFGRAKPKHECANPDREIVGSSRAPKRSGSLRNINVSSDAHRRALRDWLRDVLSIRAVGHHPATAAFLLLGSIVPEERDLLDIRRRENIDEQRRRKRVQVAQGAAERAKAIHEYWSDIKNEFVNGQGIHNLSKALRESSTIAELPTRFHKVVEWLRMSLAERLHELLVIGNQSDVLFGKLIGLHAALPWTLLKNVLKMKKPDMMCKAFLEVFVSKKLNLGKSKHSLIQRLIEIALNETEDSPAEVDRRIQACRARIQSLTMCEKIIKFVHATKHLKDLFRQYSESADIELVVAIVRSAEEPRLDKYDLERIMRASKVYKFLLKKNRNRITNSMTENIHVRLMLDLKLYLRLISQEWDSRQIRKMLSEDSTTDAIEVLLTPLLEFFKRTYQIGNAVKALEDVQKFMEQLITVINALRSRIQDPQKSIRTVSRLLARHQDNLYEWLHRIHAQDSLIEEILQWVKAAMNLLKEGLAEPLMISEVMTSGDLQSLDQELDEIVEWEEQKRRRQYEQLCRLYSADVDGDDSVIVEGDGFGKSKVEPLIDLKPLPPQLDHIAGCLEFFRRAIGKTFLT